MRTRYLNAYAIKTLLSKNHQDNEVFRFAQGTSDTRHEKKNALSFVFLSFFCNFGYAELT
jgi:hypothetical protein